MLYQRVSLPRTVVLAHGFAHIEEGPSAVRARAFEGGKFSLESLGARRPLKIAEHFPCINDGRTHRGAPRRIDVHPAIECSGFSEFGIATFLLFFDTPLAHPQPRQRAQLQHIARRK
jgi:hypothetical protein